MAINQPSPAPVDVFTLSGLIAAGLDQPGALSGQPEFEQADSPLGAAPRVPALDEEDEFEDEDDIPIDDEDEDDDEFEDEDDEEDEDDDIEDEDDLEDDDDDLDDDDEDEDEEEDEDEDDDLQDVSSWVSVVGRRCVPGRVWLRNAARRMNRGVEPQGAVDTVVRSSH